MGYHPMAQEGFPVCMRTIFGLSHRGTQKLPQRSTLALSVSLLLEYDTHISTRTIFAIRSALCTTGKDLWTCAMCAFGLNLLAVSFSGTVQRVRACDWLQLLGEAVSAAGEYPGNYQISRAVEINLQLAEVRATSPDQYF